MNMMPWFNQQLVIWSFERFGSACGRWGLQIGQDPGWARPYISIDCAKWSQIKVSKQNMSERWMPGSGSAQSDPVWEMEVKTWKIWKTWKTEAKTWKTILFHVFAWVFHVFHLFHVFTSISQTGSGWAEPEPGLQLLDMLCLETRIWDHMVQSMEM